MRVCRVCLAMEGRMYHIVEHKLSAMYERVTGVEINTEDKLPRELCWECVARLSSANNFIKKALKTQWILSKKIDDSKFITINDVESVDKVQHKLESTLGIKFVNEYDFVIAEETSGDEHPIKTEQVYNIYSLGNGTLLHDKDGETKQELAKTIKQEATDREESHDNESFNTMSLEEIKVDKTSEMCEVVRQHHQIDTNSIEELFICDICSKPFHRKSTLVWHIQNHEKLYKSRHKSNLTKHISEDSKSTYNCPDCSYKSYERSNLKRHINYKHTKIEVFNCSSCSYKTFDTNNLNKHIRIKHTNNTSYNCPYCSYKTYYDTNLSRHINCKHTKTTYYNCSYCLYKTCYKSDLDRHINCKHTKSTSYKCPYCLYKTFNKTDLNQHISCKHTKNIFYSCSHCSYKTCYKSDLNKHINCKHTKKTSYNCSYCSFQTYYQNYLSKHIKRKHT